jgi:competence protein ComEA
MKLAVQILTFAFSLGLLTHAEHHSAANESASTEDVLSEEIGREVTEQVCTGCHGVDFFAGKRQTREMWRFTVEDMFGRGAVGTAQQFEQIVSYLSAYRGTTTNVNEADARILGQVLDIPRYEAQAIVDFRTANGKFDDLEDLKKVPGLDPERLEEQVLNLAFE